MTRPKLRVELQPWSTGDLSLLQELNAPEMKQHIGGPETADQLIDRQAQFEAPGSRQFRIVVAGSEPAGWVGYWERTWRDEQVWEVGWAVVPRFQGRGVATAATTQVLTAARAEHRMRFVHAYPSLDNGPSNALCRTVGFELLGSHDFEFPTGSGRLMRCNDWRFDLNADP